jgi:uncharacterized protein (UPF0333 family)
MRNHTKSVNNLGNKAHIFKKKGQSTVEYLILVSAVIAVLIVFLKKDGVFHDAYNAALTSGTNGMNTLSTRLGSGNAYGN